jgi:hypothetical protein
LASSDPPADRDDVDPEDVRYFFKGPIFRVMHLRVLLIWDDYLTWDTGKVNTGKEIDRTGILFARTVIFSGAGI